MIDVKSCSKYSTLIAIYMYEKLQNDGCSHTDLSIALGISKNNLSNIMNRLKETCLFDGIKKKYIIQEYHRIDPSLFHYKYQCNYQVTIDKAELMFIDRDNLFPSINISRDGFKVLPLTFTQEGENIFLHFKRMYINPSTYEISTTPLTGYTNTKYLYLPRNKQSKFNNYVFYLNVNGIGLNKISFNHEFKIETLRPLIGSCDSATYCVVGGRSYE